jgi:hypothetical protein
MALPVNQAVRGGREITEATLVDDAVIDALEESAHLALLHVPLHRGPWPDCGFDYSARAVS